MEKIKNAIADLIVATPKALVFFASSFLSGQLWVYIIFTYFRDNERGDKYLNTMVGKTALGAGWFIVPLFLLYLIKFGFTKIEGPNVLDITYDSILYGAVIQVIILLIITWINRKS